MSHIHIPDGVFPVWLWVSGFAVSALVIAFSLWRVRSMDSARKIPLLGVMAAMMVVTMSVELVPIAYHINMSVVAGVLLGPALGFICAAIVEVILALLGHGGVTVIGLNTLMIGTEVALGWVMFNLFVRLLGRAKMHLPAAVATACTLLVTTSMAIGLVAISGINPRAGVETGLVDPQTLRLENPFAARAEPEEHDVSGLPAERLSLRRFAILVYLLALPGWLLEALLTSFMLGFVAKVRPDLVGLGPPHRPLGEAVTDYGRH